jgi:hypothetical protein
MLLPDRVIASTDTSNDCLTMNPEGLGMATRTTFPDVYVKGRF